MLARIHVTLKRGVLDPQGKAVAHALGQLGYEEVVDARLSKVIELDLQGSDPQAALARVEQMCKQLLVNSVIEDFRVEME
jgi:phosphoribosylformylglycinamidine synthase